MVTQPSRTVCRIVSTVVQGLAILVTLFRLYYRFHQRRFWWDDGWAALSMILNLGLLAAVWTGSAVSASGLPPLSQPVSARIVAYWFEMLLFTSSLWAARVSIVASVIRILPPMLRLRRFAIASGIVFILMWLALVIQKTAVCASTNDWHYNKLTQCRLGTAVGITELCTAFISDSVLVIIPLRYLWRVNLPPNQRKLILTLFSASVLTTLASIPHVVFTLRDGGLVENITAHVETSTALIVCNLLVLVTYVYRLFGPHADLESFQPEGTPPSDVVVRSTITPSPDPLHTLADAALGSRTQTSRSSMPIPDSLTSGYIVGNTDDSGSSKQSKPSDFVCVETDSVHSDARRYCADHDLEKGSSPSDLAPS